MFKALAFGSLLLSSFAIRFERNHEEVTWSDITKLNDADQAFDDFFRDQIKALGDSVAERIAHEDGNTKIQYLDTTGDHDEKVAWEVDGSGKDEKRIEKVVQVKTATDPDNENVSTVTTTTFLRDNLINVAKNTFA